MAPASLGQQLRSRRVEPAVGLRVENFDFIAIDLVVGVERAESIRSPSEHKHLGADDGSRVEVSPSSRRALKRQHVSDTDDSEHTHTHTLTITSLSADITVMLSENHCSQTVNNILLCYTHRTRPDEAPRRHLVTADLKHIGASRYIVG